MPALEFRYYFHLLLKHLKGRPMSSNANRRATFSYLTLYLNPRFCSGRHSHHCPVAEARNILTFNPNTLIISELWIASHRPARAVKNTCNEMKDLSWVRELRVRPGGSIRAFILGKQTADHWCPNPKVWRFDARMTQKTPPSRPSCLGMGTRLQRGIGES